MKYYRAFWSETRGGEYNHWGTSNWYFELDLENYPNRQIEIYENGQKLKYHIGHLDDEFGGLADQPIDLEEMNGIEISKSDFEAVWNLC